MSVVNQFYEMIAEEYSRIERLKELMRERGEIIANILASDLDEAEKRYLIDHLPESEA